MMASTRPRQGIGVLARGRHDRRHAGLAVEGGGARQCQGVDDPDERLHDTEHALHDLVGAGVRHGRTVRSLAERATLVRAGDRTPLELADPSDAHALIRVQRAAYAVEAELIGSTAIPALHETAADLAPCGETVLGREVDGRLVAAVGYRREGDELDLCRLVVDPPAFRAATPARCSTPSMRPRPRAADDGVDGPRQRARAAALRAARLPAGGQREVAPGLWIAELERP